MHHRLAVYDGFCAGCGDERPLVLLETGPRGFRGWLAGAGVEDRTLSYTCRLCGRAEHVPPTETEDVEYDAALPRWPDTFLGEPVPELVAELAGVVAVETVVLAAPVASVLLAEAVAPAPPVLLATVPLPRRPQVRVITLPGAQVRATDLVLAAA